MKKILLGLILLLISSMVFAGDYSESTDSMNIELNKGWNTFPLFYDSTNYLFYSLGSLAQCNPIVSYFHYPKYNKYEISKY